MVKEKEMTKEEKEKKEIVATEEVKKEVAEEKQVSEKSEKKLKKEEKKNLFSKKPLGLRIASIATRIMSIICLIGVVLYALLCAPILFGSIPEVVLSGSMEPALSPGDLIYYSPVTKENIAIGDIVSFKHEGTMISHRVVKIAEDGKYETRGDANGVSDDKKIAYSEIEGKVESFKIPLVGYVVIFIQSHLWIVLIIAAIFIADYLLHL